MPGGPCFGFSGTRWLDVIRFEDKLESLVQTVVELGPRLCVTGACKGFDAFIGHSLAMRLSDSLHLVIVPYDRSRVDVWWTGLPNVAIMEMRAGTTYEDRNKEIVRYGEDRLIALPSHLENHPSSLRSGTWQTIRMAKRAGRAISYDTLDKWKGNT